MAIVLQKTPTLSAKEDNSESEASTGSDSKGTILGFLRLQMLYLAPLISQVVGFIKTRKLRHLSLTGKPAYSEEAVFRGDNRGIAFEICADGVNPFRTT